MQKKRVLKQSWRCDVQRTESESLIVAGCLSERYKDEILKESRKLTLSLERQAMIHCGAVEAALAGKTYEHYESIDYLPDHPEERGL